MKEKIIDAHTNCILTFKNLTPIEALEVLESLKYGLIKSHNIDRPNPMPDLSWNKGQLLPFKTLEFVNDGDN